MIKSLNNTLKMDKEKYKVPRSVQECIPIRRIWKDGIFQVGNKFSKCIRFSDINYAIASKSDKTEMFLDYSELLNALDTYPQDHHQQQADQPAGLRGLHPHPPAWGRSGRIPQGLQ